MKPVLMMAFGAGLLFLTQVLAGCVWGFSRQTADDYASSEPKFDAKRDLAGRYLSEGLIYDYTGRVQAQFKAEMVGDFTENSGVLKEYFTYASGNKQTREWTLLFNDDGTFTATAPDVIGVAKGRQSGNTLSMRYKLKLEERAGGHVLDVTDWMYLTDEGTILNRSQMRKFGIKVAELVAVFKHRDLAQSQLAAAE